MSIKKYNELGSLQYDALREIGSIGSGNAATALSGVLSQTVEMTVPTVSIMSYNDAIHSLGGPENIVAGVLVMLSGNIKGIMLYIQELSFIKVITKTLLSKTVNSFDDLGELEYSALIEVGNIMVSSYMNAISTLAGIEINLSVPAMSINMVGGILNAPMVEQDYEADELMMIDGKFLCNGKEVSSNLVLVPDVQSLNFLLQKLGVSCE